MEMLGRLMCVFAGIRTREHVLAKAQVCIYVCMHYLCACVCIHIFIHKSVFIYVHVYTVRYENAFDTI